MSEDFSTAPRSIGELRSDRSLSPADWSPRDVLVSTLRDLDSGAIKPTDLVVLWRDPKTQRDATPRPAFRWAGQDSHILIGMMTDLTAFVLK